jgi:glycosyltransferase involved in cell wall biosynthesis
MPSTWDEVSGLVAAEAMARGVPAIVSRNTGAAELVTRTGGGIVVEPGDVAGLRRAMVALAEPGCAARLGAAAYAGYWRDPPTIARHVDLLEALYRSLLRPAAEPLPSTAPLALPGAA